jgi:16S rRNA (guanine966-N2)-methyltransferase
VWVQSVDALSWLERIAAPASFDIVFVDPPYDANLQAAALAVLASRQLLAPDARVYVEHRAREPLPALPAGWKSVRDGRAGEVGYHLLAT